MENGMFDLYIDYIKRNNYSWEGYMGLSLFHYFNESENHIFNNTIFQVEPTLFIYNNYSSQKDSFKLNIFFKDLNLYPIYTANTFRNLNLCTVHKNNNNFSYDCTVESSSLINNPAENFNIYIKDNQVNLDFIFYELEPKSRQCKTKNEQIGDLTLLINIPNPKYKDLIYLNSESYVTINPPKRSDHQINYTLLGNEIDLSSLRFSINILGYENINEKFSLKDLGLTIIPFYYMKSKNDEKKIILLPDKDQTLTLDIFVKDNYMVDPNDIQYLGINGHNSSILIVNSNTINATFDLSWVKNEIIKEYELYYIDKCGITTYTNLTISVASFTVQRNYFVMDNNLDYMKTQRLIIYGPTGDYLRLFAYRGNSQEGILVNFNISDNNYYLDFDQSSSGEYTFKIFNNGIELAKIVDIVYVTLELSDFFKYDNLPTCSFLDNNKEVLNDISYNIEIADINKIKSITIFKSTLKNNDSFLLNFTEKIYNDNKKAFILNKTKTLEEKISTNIEMFFYLTEKDYMDQPLYVFKLKYTNISLNSIASEVIYSDTQYIPLDMSCKIDDIDIFHLKSIDKNEELSIQCDSYLYDETNNIYKCYLSEEDKDNNPLLKLGDSNFNYGYYNLTYSNKRYLVSKKPFYLSHEIETVDFGIEREEQIDINYNTNVKILLTNKIFYLPYIEKVNYNDDKGMNNPLEAKFNCDFDSNPKSLSFNIFIEAKHTYIINEICRIPCDYCLHDDCWNNPNKYNVTSNTKNITFEFNRKYIALNNSTNQDNSFINTELKIKIGGDDIGNLKEVICKYMKKDGITFNNKIYNNWPNDEIIIPNPEVGKYEFNYTVEEEGKPDKTFIIKNKVVLVSDYDYEIFNLTELYKKCIYYDDIQGELYALITKNKSYIYQDYVNIADLIIIINNVEFEFSNNKLYHKFSSDTEFLNNKDYNIMLKEKEHKELKLIFTKFEQEISVTSFNFSTKIDYFYKDNIVTMNQTCDLDNIYIGEIDYNSILYYKLNCKYTDTFTKKSYCEADYKFTNIPSKEFALFIGYSESSDYFPINKSKLIYNSIKDSDFSLSYKENIITISSKNFNMTHINHVRIDDNITINSINFKQNISDSIQFYFYNSNYSSIKNYVKELVRKEHEEDRENVIKNKLVNLEIIEKECGELLYNYQGACITCQTFSEISTENSDRKWFQDYDCVTRCDFDNGYGISSRESYICSKCETRTKLANGEFLCGCGVDGTVKSFEDGNCYLPESPEIKKLLLIKSNAQCYLEDGNTTNYCNASNTEDCITYGNSGYLFPQCICKNGYSGKYCEIDNNNNINEELQKKMDEILSDENDEIDESNFAIISKIRGVTFFLEKDGLQYTQNIEEESINKYIQRSLKSLSRIVEKTKNSTPQIYDVLNMAIFFLKYKITYQKLRSLQEDKDKDDLNYILKYLHYANFYGNKDTEQDYNIQTNGLGIMSFIKYKNSIVDSDDFKQEMSNTTEFKIMEYIKINTTKTKYIYVTLINNSIFDENSLNDDLGINVSFSTNESINVDDLSEIKDLTFYISSLDIKFNFNLAQYYENKKIRIYNKADKAFVEPCYLSKLFDYDLTQKYRKNNIYQKIYYGSQKCSHISFESKFNRLIFNCSEFDNVEKIDNASDILYYGTFLINIEKDSLKNKLVYNLPTKCINKIDDLGNNMAFWFFLIIIVIEIIYSIGINILNFGRLKKTSYSKAVENDELIEAYVIPYEKPIPHEDDEENNKQPYNEKFSLSIIKNFFELHPLSTIFRVSIISPLILNSWFFVYNMLSLFGFNALLYYEDLIEKRIYDKRRNNFAYPMRKEFHKILLSIIIQAILTTLLKFLVIVMLKDRNELKNNLGKKFNLKEKEFVDAQIIYRIDQFQKYMFLRRIIACVIMTSIVAFFFYYSVAFCGIYIKSQANWFYSGIWSLIWNWFILSPIYIIVITIIEKKKRHSFDPLVYNLKRLFCF